MQKREFSSGQHVNRFLVALFAMKEAGEQLRDAEGIAYSPAQLAEKIISVADKAAAQSARSVISDPVLASIIREAGVPTALGLAESLHETLLAMFAKNRSGNYRNQTTDELYAFITGKRLPSPTEKPVKKMAPTPVAKVSKLLEKTITQNSTPVSMMADVKAPSPAESLLQAKEEQLVHEVEEFERKAKEIERLDAEIVYLQQSTRTRFRVFRRVHAYLSVKSRLYHRLHTYQYSSQLHVGVLAAFTLASVLFLAQGVIVKPAQTLASDTFFNTQAQWKQAALSDGIDLDSTPDKVQLKLGAKQGTLSIVHDSLTESSWTELQWSQLIPEKGAIAVRSRAAQTTEGLAQAPWSKSVIDSPINLESLPVARYLEVEFSLTSPDGIHTPILNSAQLIYGLPVVSASRTVAWTGSGTTSHWSDADNWEGRTVPGENDSVIFDGTSQKDSVIDGAFKGTIVGLSLAKGYAGKLTFERSLHVRDAATWDGGTAVVGAYTLTVDGNWKKGLTNLNLAESTVEFAGNRPSTISGLNVFNNLISTTPDKHLFFEKGNTQTVEGKLTIIGTPGHLVQIRSTNSGQDKWKLNAKGETELKLVHIGDTDNVSGKTIKALPSNSYGNNANVDTDPTWDGGGVTTNWSEANNWDTNVIPGSSDTVTFDATSAKASKVDASFAGTIATMNVNAAYSGTVTLARSLTVTANLTNRRTIQGAGNALTVGGTLDNYGTINAGVLGTNEVQTITATSATGSATVTVPATTLGAGGTLTIAPSDSAATVAANAAAIAAIGSTANLDVATNFSNPVVTKSAVLPSARSSTSAVWDPDTGKSYIFGGYAGSPLNAILEYDPSTDALVTKSAVLPSGRSGTSAVWSADTGKAYIFGGAVVGSATNAILEYDPSTDALVTKSAVLPGARSSTSAVLNPSTGKAYIFGGGYGGFSNTIYEYDPATDTSSTMPTVLPTATTYTAAVWSTSTNKAYIFGGANSSPSILEYDPATGTLVAKSAVMSSIEYLASAVWNASTGKAYIFGGYASGSATNAILEYDPVADTIATKTAVLPTIRRETSAVLNPSTGKAYIFGGYTGSVNLNSIVEYTPNTFSGTYTLTFQGSLAVKNIAQLTTVSSGWSAATDTDGYDGSVNEVQTITAASAGGAATVTVPATILGAGGTLTINPTENAATVATNAAAIAAIGSTANIDVNSSLAADATATIKSATLPSGRTGTSAVWNPVTGKAYIFGGTVFGTGYVGTIIEYEPSTGTVVTKSASLPTGKDLTSAVLNPATGKAYIFGGFDASSGSVAYNTIVEYDTGTGVLTTKSAVLPSGRYGTSAVWNPATGKAYIFGGSTLGSDLNSILEYDPGTDSLVTKSAVLPTGRRSTSSVWNPATGKAYIFGGSDSGFLDTILEYDPSIDSLTTKSAVLPSARNLTAAAWNPATGKAYIFGGTSGGSQILEYDPSIDSLTTKSTVLPSDRSRVSAVFNPATGKYYVFGGVNTSTSTATILEYEADSYSGAYTLTFQGALAGLNIPQLTTASSSWTAATSAQGGPGLVGNWTIGTLTNESGGTMTVSGATTSVSSNFTNAGTFNHNSGTTILSGSTGSMSAGSAAFNNLTFNKSSSWMINPGTFSVAGDLVNSGAGAISESLAVPATISVGGNITQSGAGSFTSTRITFNMTGVSKAFSMSAGTFSTKLSFSAAGQTISQSGGTFGSNNTTTVASGGSVTASTALSPYALTVASGGTLSMGANNLTVNNAFTNAGTFTAPSGILAITGAFNNTGTYNHNSGTVTFDHPSRSYSVATGGATFYNVSFIGTNPLYRVTMTDSFTVNNTLTNAADVAVEMMTGTVAITVKGDIVGTGNSIFGGAALTLLLNGTTDQNINSTGSLSAPITINKASGKVIAQKNMNLGSLTITSGIVYLNGKNLTVNSVSIASAGTLQMQGAETLTVSSFGTASGTVEYLGDGDAVADAYTVKDFGTTDYYNLRINSTDAADTFTSGAGKSIVGDLSVVAGTYLSSGSTTAAASYTQTGGTFVGSSGAVTISGNFNQSGGNLTAPTSLTVGGDFTHSAGTFSHNLSTVTLNGVTQAMNGATTFYNLYKSRSNGGIVFQSGIGNKTTILGRLTLIGDPSPPLYMSLSSSTPGSQAYIEPQGTRSINYLKVKDNNNSDARAIMPPAWTDQGNNVNWSSTNDATASLTTPNGGELLRGGQVKTVSWTSSGTDISSVALFYSTNGGSSYPNTISTGEGTSDVLGWTVPSINTTTARVRAEVRDNMGNVLAFDTSDSNFTIDSIAPANPTSISATGSSQGGAHVDLSWTNAADSDLTGTRIYRSTSPGTKGPLVMTVTALNHTYTDPNLVVGTTYYYTLASYDSAGNESTGAAQVSATPPANTNPTIGTLGPANLVNGSTVNATAPSLSFVTADADGGDAVRYQIQVDDSSNFASPVIDYTSALATPGTAGFTVGQATGSGSYAVGSSGQTLADGSYYWRVKSIDNSSGSSSYVAANSGSVAFIVDTDAPSFSNITSLSNNPNTAVAKSGNTVTTTFDTSRALTGNPTVTLGTKAMTYVSLVGLTYTYTRILDGTETNGSAAIAISGTDTIGNLGSGSSSFATDFTAPTYSSISATSNNPVSTNRAKVGDVISLVFTPSEALSATPSVTIGGQAMTYSSFSGGIYTFTYTTVGGDTEGSKTVSITGSDIAGNSGSNSATSFTYDFTAPQPVTGLGLAEAPTQVTVTWSNPVDADRHHVNVYRSTSSETPGTVVGQSASAAATSYIDSTVSTGTTYFYTLKAADAAGNESTPTVQNSVTPHNVTVAVTSPNGSENWNPGSAHAITWNTSGAGVGSIAIYLSTNSGSSYPTTVVTGQSNTGTYAWTVPMSSGSGRRVKIEARDSEGNILINDTSDADFQINTLPTVSGLAPAGLVDGSLSNVTAPAFTFTVGDVDAGDTAQYQIQIDTQSNFSSPVIEYTSALATPGAAGFTVGQAAGSGSYAVGSSGQTLADGSYYWRVKSIDSHSADSSFVTANAGSIAFKVDSTAPATPTVSSPTNGSFIGQTNVSLGSSSYSDANSHVASQWVVSTHSDFSSPLVDTGDDTSNLAGYDLNSLVNGTYYAKVRYKDAAGNYSAYSGNLSFQIDTVAPVISALSAATNGADGTARPGDTVTVTFSLSEVLAGNPVVTLGGKLMTITSQDGLAYTFTRTVDGSEGIGAVTVAVAVVDRAGNSGNATTSMTMAAAVPSATPTPTPTLSATASPTPTLAASPSASPSTTPSPTPTPVPTVNQPVPGVPSPTPSVSPSASPTADPGVQPVNNLATYVSASSIVVRYDALPEGIKVRVYKVESATALDPETIIKNGSIVAETSNSFYKDDAVTQGITYRYAVLPFRESDSVTAKPKSTSGIIPLNYGVAVLISDRGEPSYTSDTLPVTMKPGDTRVIYSSVFDKLGNKVDGASITWKLHTDGLVFVGDTSGRTVTIKAVAAGDYSGAIEAEAHLGADSGNMTLTVYVDPAAEVAQNLGIYPGTLTMKPGASSSFTGTVVNQNGSLFDPEKNGYTISWSAQAGTIVGNHGAATYTAGTKTGTYEQAIKFTIAKGADIRFAYARVTISNEDPYLHYMTMTGPGVRIDPGTTGRFYSYPYDQFGNLLTAANNAKYRTFSVSDQDAGFIDSVGNFHPNKPGCFDWIIRSDMFYNDKTAYNRSTVAVTPAIATTATSTFWANVSWVSAPLSFTFLPGDIYSYQLKFTDQKAAVKAHAVANFTLSNSSIGTITPQGYLQISPTAKPGIYAGALIAQGIDMTTGEVKWTSKYTLAVSAGVQVSVASAGAAGTFQAGVRAFADVAQPSIQTIAALPTMMATSTVNVRPNSAAYTGVGFYDQYGLGWYGYRTGYYQTDVPGTTILPAGLVESGAAIALTKNAISYKAFTNYGQFEVPVARRGNINVSPTAACAWLTLCGGVAGVYNPDNSTPTPTPDDDDGTTGICDPSTGICTTFGENEPPIVQPGSPTEDIINYATDNGITGPIPFDFKIPVKEDTSLAGRTKKALDTLVGNPLTAGIGLLSGAVAVLAGPIAQALANFSLSGFTGSADLLRVLGLWRPRRRRKQWGKVTAKSTGLPVAGASVNLIRNGIYTPLYQTVSNVYGGFDLTVTTVGPYQVVVTAPGYYSVTSPVYELGLVRPDKPLEIELAEQQAVPEGLKLNMKKLARAKEIVTAIAVPFFTIGSLLSLYAAITKPGFTSYAILALYLIVMLGNAAARFVGSVSGPVIDLENFGPVVEALVRVAQVDNDKLVIATAFTDASGHYRLKLRPGTYILTVVKEGYVAYVGQPFTIKYVGIHEAPIKLEPFLRK